MPPKTPHEEEVHQFVGYLSTQLRKIPEDNWMDFSIEAINLIKGHQRPQMHTSPAPLAPDVYQAQQQQQQQQQFTYQIPPPGNPASHPMRPPTLTPSPMTLFPGLQQPPHSQQQQQLSYTTLQPAATHPFYQTSPGFPSLSTSPMATVSPSTTRSRSSSASGKETPEPSPSTSDVVNLNLSSSMFNE